MSKLSTRQLEQARCLCLARDGRICNECKKDICNLNAVVEVDHVDGNDENNPKDGSNWQLLCHSCNVKKWHVQKRYLDKAIEVINSEKPSPVELNLGSKMELRWINWMFEVIERDGKIPFSTARYTGALEINGSPETTKRYLHKHTEDPKNEKSLFKTVLEDFDTYVVFSDHLQDDMNNRVKDR